MTELQKHEYMKVWWKQHPRYKQMCNIKYKERNSLNNKRYLRSLIGKFNYSKRKSVLRKLGWSITFPEYCELLNKPCFYCHVSITGDYGTGLDRIDNSQGYAPHNVLPCCKECNRIKHTYLSVGEMVAVAQLLKTMRSHG